MMANETIQDCFITLSNEYKDFYNFHEVPEIAGVPSAIEFARSWLSPNKPVIFRNAVKHWPAIRNWTVPYLRSKIGSKEVTVAVTPNGYADAINGHYFVMPEERKMVFHKFLEILEKRNESSVHYIQKQNSNMTEEFVDLMYDVDSDISWATEATGKKPDAVNFWMGDERAVTSMHRDHYENIYCVIKGQKDFILHPPTDLPWIPYGSYESAVYHQDNNGEFRVVPSGEGKVPWISVDPEKPDFKKYPLYKKATPVRCCIQEGDALYLPSLWFHHVRQSHGCIAVNYWYDMDFDIKYCYYKFLEALITVTEKENTA